MPITPTLTRRSVLGVLFCLVSTMGVTAQSTPAAAQTSLDQKTVVGKWQLDEPKSKAAADGNTAGLMKSLTIREDGTFEALFGTKGTWTLAGGKLLVTYENSGRAKEAATYDGAHLKFPSPSSAAKFCYLIQVEVAVTRSRSVSTNPGAKAPSTRME